MLHQYRCTSLFLITLFSIYCTSWFPLVVDSFSQSIPTTTKPQRKNTNNNNINQINNINPKKKKIRNKNKGKPSTTTTVIKNRDSPNISSNNKNNNNNNNNEKQKSNEVEPRRTTTKYNEKQLSQMTIGQAVQESSSCIQLLQTAKRMWLPSDEYLAPYLRTQTVHHEKRMKAASQLLQRFGDMILIDNDMDVNLLWKDAQENGWKRAILASYISFEGIENSIKEQKYVHMAFMGLHSVVGYTAIKDNVSSMMNLDNEIQLAIQGWVKKAESYAWHFTLREAIEIRWAIRGILVRIPTIYKSQNNEDSRHYDYIQELIPNLNERVSTLPFDIIPSCIDWNNFLQEEQQEEDEDDDSIMQTLLTEIPFKLETILTRSGSLVTERRGTAWVASDTIGALAYSGKLMSPNKLPYVVKQVMRQVEDGILQQQHNNQYDDDGQIKLYREEVGEYFDCALCNHYPDQDSACKFHTDPEHGTYWERLTCVVCAGNHDIRKFAFRPIPTINTWMQYETKQLLQEDGIILDSKNDEEEAVFPAVIRLFPGDVVFMDKECNDMFQHAVYGASSSSIGDDSNGRISLVLKKAMDRNGRKGHGIAGQGRRKKSRQLS